MSNRSPGSISVTRFHDSDGLPTCCILWGSKPDTCPLLRVGQFGLREICNWTDGHIERRGDSGLGSTIPVTGCPIHPCP